MCTFAYLFQILKSSDNFGGLKVKSICSDSGCASHVGKIDITLNQEIGCTPENVVILNLINNFRQNLDNLWQNAICTKICTFN